MSLRGNDGYFLLDALVALLVAALAAGTVLASLGIVTRHAGRSLDRAITSVEKRNADVARKVEMNEKE